MIALKHYRPRRKPVAYERIDSNNVRIGTKWYKFTQRVHWVRGVMQIISGVTIYDGNVKRFIANSWYD
jgi:hypothetical protein